MRLVLILASWLALMAAGPSTFSGDEAYVRAVTYMQQEINRLEADRKIERATEAGETAKLQERLAAAERALKELRDAPGDAAKAAALQDFAAGDGAAGLDVLEKAAGAKASAAAADWRRIGDLAFGLDTARALRAYEKAFALVPEDFATAIYLARLRKEAGNLAGARQAALAAQSAARGDREISVAADELGDVAVQAGDVNEAKARFVASLAIHERLARDNPGSSKAQRDLSVSLEKLGDVAVKAGDVNEAKARFVASLAIAERLARDNPGSAEAQRDLAVSYERLGEVAIQAGDLNSAKAWFEKELVISKQRMDEDAASAEAKRFHSVVLIKLGDVAVLAGDVNEAKARFGASLAILERLARDNPGSAQAQRDVSVGLDRLGDLLVLAGDVNEAKARFEPPRLYRRTKLSENCPLWNIPKRRPRSRIHRSSASVRYG